MVTADQEKTFLPAQALLPRQSPVKVAHIADWGTARFTAIDASKGVVLRVSPGSLKSRLIKLATGLAVVAAMVAEGTQPAAADADVPYLRTDPSAVLSCYGVALRGSVSFYNNRHHASYYFEVYDRCDGSGQGDGFAAVPRGRAIRGDGTVTAWTDWAGDDSGCADNAGRVAMYSWDLPQRRIVRIEVQLCLRKPSTGTLAGCVQPSWRNQYA